MPTALVTISDNLNYIKTLATNIAEHRGSALQLLVGVTYQAVIEEVGPSTSIVLVTGDSYTTKLNQLILNQPQYTHYWIVREPYVFASPLGTKNIEKTIAENNLLLFGHKDSFDLNFVVSSQVVSMLGRVMPDGLDAPFVKHVLSAWSESLGIRYLNKVNTKAAGTILNTLTTEQWRRYSEYRTATLNFDINLLSSL